MSTDYLIDQNIEIYMNDAVFLLLKYRKKNPGVVINQFFADYFRTVKNGNHVLYRNFNYINSTYYNRKCFLKLWWDCLQPIAKCNEKLPISEIVSLTNLLSPDFPVDLIKSAYELGVHNEISNWSFEEFGYRFQFYLIYQEFIQKLLIECKSLEINSKQLNDNEIFNKSLSAMDWLRILNKFPLKLEKIVCPDPGSMKQLVSNHSNLSLSEFFYHLVNSDFIIESIGIVKSALLMSKTSNNNTDTQINERLEMPEKISKSTTDISITNHPKKQFKPNTNLPKSKTSLTINKGKLVKADSTNSLLNKPNHTDSESRAPNRRLTYSQIKKYSSSSLVQNVDDNDEDENDNDVDSSSPSSDEESSEK